MKEGAEAAEREVEELLPLADFQGWMKKELLPGFVMNAAAQPVGEVLLAARSLAVPLHQYVLRALAFVEKPQDGFWQPGQYDDGVLQSRHGLSQARSEAPRMSRESQRVALAWSRACAVRLEDQLGLRIH